MASYVIPEEIIGIPLFVPDTYDYFSIDSGGLPNGDDCLVVHGDVSQTFLAFQKAQTLSPNVFLSRASTWSMTFWLKAPGSGGGSGQMGRFQIISVQNASYNVDSTIGSNAVWMIGADSLTSATLAFSFGAGANRIDGYRDDTWHLITVDHRSNVSDGAVWRDTSLSSGTIGANNSAVNPNMFLTIGSYSKLGNMNGYDREFRIGKLAFHDHLLNSTERALLYNAMWA